MYSQRDGLKDVWYVWIGALGRVIRDLIDYSTNSGELSKNLSRVL